MFKKFRLNALKDALVAERIKGDREYYTTDIPQGVRLLGLAKVK
jgi:hypothetical protein